MPTQIRQTEMLTDAEKHQLFEWGDDIFEVAALNLRWRPKQVHFILDVDGEPVSHVGIVKHEITVAGRPVLVGGIGGVVTIPAWQKHGYARELMQRAVNFLEQWKVDAGLLFCLESRIKFYEEQSWLLLKGPVLIQQPEVEIDSPLEVMILPMGTYRWPDGDVKLNSFPW